MERQRERFMEAVTPFRSKTGLVSHRWAWGVILIVILLTAAIRVRLLQVPLERDEGEYAYAGQLILQGIPPYAKVYNMKMPGIYAVYALILAIFGQTQAGIHLGLLTINTVTVILLFLLGKRLYDLSTGVMTGASFAVMSLNPSVQGIFANAEHFVILPAVGGILLLLRAIDSDQLKFLFWSGLLLGTAFIIKQHGGAFVAFASLYLLYNQLRYRPVVWLSCVSKCVVFLLGATVPFGLVCLILSLAGVFDKFWFWTFVYAREYVSSNPFSTGLSTLQRLIFNIVVSSSILLWSLAGIGLTALLWDKEARPRGLFVVVFLIMSFLSTCPGFHFRPHYFILLLPAIALLTGIGVNSIGRLFSNINFLTIRKGIPILLAVVALFHSLYKQRSFLLQSSPSMVSRRTYGLNPFPESLEIAKYIKEHTSKDDRIAVIGSEPQIYFYSGRHSATGYIYTYPLMETHEYALKMQQEMIDEIELARPKFLIFVSVRDSWVRKPESKRLIFDWFNQYQQKYYDLVGIIDILSPEPTRYYWDNESVGYLPRSRWWLAVSRRKE